MGIFDGCLLVSDIDGTLLYDGTIPEANIKAIKWFKDEGGVFAIATGRGVPAAKYSYDISNSNAPIIALNGSIIYDYATDKVMHHKTLSHACQDIVFEIINTFPTIGAEICSGPYIYLIKGNKGTKGHSEYEHFEFLTLPDDLDSIPWSKVLFAFEEEGTLEKVQEFVKKYGSEYGRFITTCVSETVKYFEFLPPGADKGTALKELKKLSGCKYSFGIGDFYNDAELISLADYGAAVLAAPDEIKELANYVTCRCEDGAVADFIDKISLFMKGSSVWTR